MDLLACVECGHRFYVPGEGASDNHCCPSCGGSLDISLHGMKSIPLDARWLDPRAPAVDPPEVTIVELRSKRARAGRVRKRIVKDLADYFAVRGDGDSVEVAVNRGEPAEAPLRVAAVLDGVDGGWEEHFYLPTAEPQDRHRVFRSRPPIRRGHLRLVDDDNTAAEGGPA
jgi:hypothetical protein